MDKKEKLEIIKNNLGELEQQIKHAEMAAEDAQSDANGHIGAMASRYDTFKEEAQYMSAAQRIRMCELRELWQKTKVLYEEIQKGSIPYSTVGAGSFVTLVDDNDDKMNFLILYYGTAKKISCYGKITTVIGIESPIATAILGLAEGDETEICLPRKNIHVEIIYSS